MRGWLATNRRLVRDALGMFSARGARMMSGSVAFYAMLSVVPILVIALAIAGLVIPPERITPTLEHELARWVGDGGARVLLGIAAQVQRNGPSVLENLISALTLLYSSTRLFSQLTTALDLLWDTPPAPRAKHFGERVLRQLEKRGVAFAMVLLSGVLLIGLFIVHSVIASARHVLDLDAAPLSRAAEALASFGVTVLLFSAMFRFLPRAKVTFRDALTGGVVTAVLFTLGSLLVTAYVTRRNIGVYGAASSIVMLLVWVHYSAQVFFLGAAFTAAHARRLPEISAAPP